MIQSINFAKMLLIGALFLSVTSCEKEEILTDTKIPAEIQAYVNTHFPNHNILQVKEDTDLLSHSYEVVLSGGIKLEFNNKKEIVEISSPNELPSSVIPEKIGAYVKTNFPDNTIIKWELDKKQQEVKLNNDIELVFTLEGEFLRIGD